MLPLTLSIALSILLSGPVARPQQLFPQSNAPSETYARSASLALVNQGVSYKTYSNARYGYSIAYPAGILVPQGEADNGDGQVFVSKDKTAEMRVFGSNIVQGETLQSAFDVALAGENDPEWVVSYKLLKKDYFVVSGKHGARIFYFKTMKRGNVFKSVIIQYDESERAIYDPITARVSRSFVG
jgi:hypothetical protein